MMKSKSLLAALVLVVALCAPQAQAQRGAPREFDEAPESRTPSHSRHVVGGSFGHTVLFGDWGARYDDNFSFSGYYAFEATPIFGFIFNLGYSHHKGTAEDRLMLWSMEPDLKVNLFYFDNVAFYTMGGFGLYPVAERVGPSDANVLAFGMNFGFGVDLRMGPNFTFGPGIQFRSVFSKVDGDVKNSAFPNGMPVGGETVRLYVQAGYLF